GYHSAKGGDMHILQPCQQVLETSSVLIDDSRLELRIELSLPAFGRKIAGDYARRAIVENLPKLANAVLHGSIDPNAVLAHVLSVEDQDALRQRLIASNLVAFVINGAILPRASGDS